MGESGRDSQEDEFEVDQRIRQEFERTIIAGDQPSWDTLYYFRECDDLMPIQVAEVVYNLAPSAFDLSGDPAPISYRNTVRILWELKTFIDGPLNDSE